MPTMPATVHVGPRLPRTEQRQEQDRRRRQAKPWRRWYGLAAWHARRVAQLTAAPWCCRCAARGEPNVPATVANHVEPHRGDWRRFIAGELESVCKPCHDREVQREEARAARL